MIRCYNCGTPGHKTPACPRHGPYFPAPGKTSQDYGEEVQRISDLFAKDIIREHGGDIGEDDDLPTRPPRTKKGKALSSREERDRRVPCSKCAALKGRSCVSSGGNETKTHSVRVAASTQGWVD